MVYLLGGFLIVPIIIKSKVVGLIKEQFRRDSKIESISFNPITFNLSIEGLSILDKDNSAFLYWEKLNAEPKILPLLKSRIELDDITLTNPSIKLTRLNQTEFNFSDLIRLQKSSPDTSWKILIKNLDVKNLSIIFIDKSLSSSAEIFIDSIDFEAANINPFSQDTASFKTRMKFRNGGNIIADGFFSLQPIFSLIHYEVSDLSLEAFDNYVEELAALKLEKGNISVSGDLYINNKDTSIIPLVNYNGDFKLKDLAIYESKSGQKVVECKSLDVNQISMSTRPFSIKVNDILVNEVYLPVTIDTSIDIVKALKSIPVLVEKTKSTISKISDTPIKDIYFEMGEIKINNCEVILTDLSLPQKFTADIHSLNGTISSISMDRPLSTSISANGLVDENGVANIEGKINLLDPLSFASLDIIFKNINLTHFTPYAMKFMGYKVKNGQMSLDLKYEIKNEMLISKNLIHLNELTLGEKVENSSILDFPLEVGLALLKDKNGNIDLDVDISGDLNDPDINVGELIWWGVKRSFTKVIEAPFNYLGELLGISGDDLEYVEFTQGSAELLPKQTQELDHLGDAMNQRPELILQISGLANQYSDGQAIRSIKTNTIFTKEIKTGLTDSLINPLNIDPNISKDILERLSIKIIGKDSLEITKSKYSDLMDQNDMKNYVKELLMVIENNQTLTQDELYGLANQRAEAIKNYLILNSQISPNRLLLLVPEIETEVGENQVKCRLSLDTL